MLTTTAADGTEVRAYDEGEGPAILVLHAGMDDGTRWGRVAGLLADRFRVVRLIRRQYRLDLPGPVTMAEEVEHVRAIAALLDGPVVVVGHSSGGVLALESMLELPFAGAVIYEAALEIPPGSWAEPVRDAMAALERGKIGKPMAIFLRDVIKLPAAVAALSGVYLAIRRTYRGLVPRQIYDARAIHLLGGHHERYSRITAPTTVLTGERSSPYIAGLVAACLEAVPHAEKVVLPKQGHAANLTAPELLAREVAAACDRIRSRTVEG
ncbi:alpha/beta fold hydrolase [Tenggerimyces flavus]|uniref:Alpha/beta fold hydrolase n=1 Tax=Tenggerimyces flavus TaxID=1708749 RepID=A0ABV7YHL6_9ACTN|nr:alpha/beta hydrolase [Tenggerimyces flavus]MBM7783891.1 pimeloyl-ACP methyl ester carboxylesterase [Tenggerimyces flavus]